MNTQILNALPHTLQVVVTEIATNVSQNLGFLDTELEQRISTAKDALQKDITQLTQDMQTAKNLYQIDKRFSEIQELFKDDKLARQLMDEFPLKFTDNVSLKSAFNKALLEAMRPIQQELVTFSEQLTSKEEIIKKQQNWMQLQFPESVLTSHPDFVDFIMDSGIGYKIVMFQNSKQDGALLHNITCDAEGNPIMLCNGVHQRWEDIKKLVFYDPNQGKIASLEDTKQGWNYISPKGLVPKDPYNYENLYSIDKIPNEEYKEILEHAQKYWQTHEEIDPGIEKDCIFQIVTTKRAYVPDSLPSFIKDNLNDNYPSHVYMHFIKPNGKVYSSGFEMKHTEQKEILGNVPFSLLTSGLTQWSNLDYEEPRKFEVRYITSIPITRKRLNESLQYIADKNKQINRFCFVDDNCAKGAIDVAKINDVEIDTITTLKEYAYRILPDFDKIPGIGAPFIEIAQKIQFVARVCLAVLPPVSCEVIEGGAKTLSEAVQQFESRLQNLFTNCMVYLLGGAEMTKALRESTDAPSQQKPLLNTQLDFLNTAPALLYHPAKVTEWQLQQPSTLAIPFEGKTRLYLHPRTQVIKA